MRTFVFRLNGFTARDVNIRYHTSTSHFENTSPDFILLVPIHEFVPSARHLPRGRRDSQCPTALARRRASRSWMSGEAPRQA